jgi:hypothetical protein
VSRFVPLLVPLLFMVVYLWDGIRRAGGYVARSVSTRMSRLTGTSSTLPTTAVSSSPSTRGDLWAERAYQAEQRWVSSSIGLSSFGNVTGDRGVNGPQRLRSVD